MKGNFRKTKIVGTIGPASENILNELFDAGLNVCRINYSHGSYEEQEFKTNEIIRIRNERDLPIPMILDMKGPEIRTGVFSEKIFLNDNDTFTLCNEDIISDNTRVSVSYKELYNE